MLRTAAYRMHKSSTAYLIRGTLCVEMLRKVTHARALWARVCDVTPPTSLGYNVHACLFLKVRVRAMCRKRKQAVARAAYGMGVRMQQCAQIKCK